MKKYWVGFLLLFLLAVASGIAYLGSCPLPAEDGPVTLTVPEGYSTAQVAELLHESRIIRNRLLFRALTRLMGADGKIQSGEFDFEPGIYAWDCVKSLLQGRPIYYTLTVPEGFSVESIGKLIEDRGFGSAVEFIEVAKDLSLLPDFISSDRIGETRYPLEGYLFPDTYYIRKGMSEREIAVMMLNRFAQVFDKDLRDEAEAMGMTPHEVCTLASIVEKEAYDPDERTTIAGVFLNRLDISMTLGACPTVLYAINKPEGPLLWSETEVDSPYNTYKYAGLPPGPIASFGKASLEAALNPRDVDYLYFVAKSDGTHAFARTLTEHNRNIALYQGQ